MKSIRAIILVRKKIIFIYIAKDYDINKKKIKLKIHP